MFARVSIIQTKPDQIEAGVRNFREQVGPVASKMVGFKGSYLLVDRVNGKMLGVALWDTKEHLQASNTTANQLRAGVAKAASSTKPPVVEIYEVAVQL